MTALLQDARVAARSVARMRGVGLVVVTSLAVAIGVNTAVFSWIEAVVLRPVPGVDDASAIHLVEPKSDIGSYPGASWPEYLDLRSRLRAIPDLVAFRMAPLNVGEPGRTERAYALLVSGNYFAALRLRPAAGRVLTAADAARAGGEPVAVVSARYSRAHLGGNRQAVGRELRVNGTLITIVGVAPERFQGTLLGLDFDLWIPATMAPVLIAGSPELDDRTQRGYSLIGRLDPASSVAAAQVEATQAMRDLAAAHPQTNATTSAEVLPFWKAPRGPQRMLASALFVLQMVLLLLLLAVCGNTANLLLARASVRRREMAMRAALGASPARIARLVLAESVLVATIATVLGIVLAAWATDALRAVPIVTAFPIRFQTELDLVSIVFALALAAAASAACGVGPALRLAHADPQAAFRSGLREAGRSRLRTLLMTTEVGLATVVLMAAALFVRTFADARNTDPGFRADGVLLAAFDRTGENPDSAKSRDFARRLLDRVRALPAVESAAIAASVPLDIHGLPLRAFAVADRPLSAAAPEQALMNTVTPGYFRTMSIPFTEGRDFVPLGDQTAAPEAIVNAAFAHRFLADGATVGRRLTIRGTGYVVIGVVRNSTIESFNETPPPVIYLSFRDRPAARGELHVRTRPGAEALLAPALERAARDLDPMLPLYDVRTLAEHIDKNLFLRRIPARMFVVLGPLLLALAASGIYAVVAYTVSQRTTEIGIRVALGGTSTRVAAEVAGESVRAIAAGALSGWLVALLVDVHLLRGGADPAVFAAVPAVLLAVGTLAAWLPAHRAAIADPLAAIREE